MKFLLSIVLFLSVSACSAQSFFRPIPKPGHSFTDKLSLAPGDSVINAFRPVVNMASFGLGSPGGAALTGAGVSYQHLSYSAATGKWTAIWSINALAWYKTPVDPSVPNPNAFAYGLAGGFFNNLILVGGAYDGKNIFATLGIGISLNN